MEVAHIPIRSPIRFLASNPGGGREGCCISAAVHEHDADDLPEKRNMRYALIIAMFAWGRRFLLGRSPRPVTSGSGRLKSEQSCLAKFRTEVRGKQRTTITLIV